ncbi:hypothetical protein NE237_000717 [Protea cynaroides]|uniref:Uncharacterized protein n=1 Tax=Protea cynaroides TaxID=273540 RepID=A0A9Q0KRZ7_9MAGN|nr:hypothetical protein NE237_000717 [Protea cynaroides]
MLRSSSGKDGILFLLITFSGFVAAFRSFYGDGDRIFEQQIGLSILEANGGKRDRTRFWAVSYCGHAWHVLFERGFRKPASLRFALVLQCLWMTSFAILINGSRDLGENSRANRNGTCHLAGEDELVTFPSYLGLSRLSERINSGPKRAKASASVFLFF